MAGRGSLGALGALALAVGVGSGAVASFQLDDFSEARKQRPFWISMPERTCEATHPVETWKRVRQLQAREAGAFVGPVQWHVCEKQHVIQQGNAALCSGSDKRECDSRTTFWPQSLHNYTDRSNRDAAGRPVFMRDTANDRGITGDNHYDLEAAYKMGAYGIQYTFMYVDYSDTQTNRGGGNVHLTSMNMDGVSNLAYIWTWLVNTPQKFVNQAVYVWNYNAPELLIDLVVGLLWFTIIDLPLAVLSTVVGVICGTVLNPIDTVLAIPGGLWILGESIWTGGKELVLAVPRLVNGTT